MCLFVCFVFYLENVSTCIGWVAMNFGIKNACSPQDELL